MTNSQPGKRRAMIEGAVVVAIFPCIYYGLGMLGWNPNSFPWWQVILMALLLGSSYWAFTSSFRKFVNEDVTPKQ